MTWAWSLDLPPRDKFVLVALCDYYNDDQQAAWMKQGTLAEKTGYARCTVNAALQALEHQHGLITSEARSYPDGRRASNTYRIIRNTPTHDRRKPPETHVGQSDTAPHRVGQSDTDHVGQSDTDRVGQTDSMNHQHRTRNIEPLPPLRKPTPTVSPPEDEDAELGLGGKEPPPLDLTHREQIEMKLGPNRFRASHLSTFHRPVFDALIVFRRLHGSKATDEMFRTWARQIQHDIHDHGQPVVAEALDAAIGNYPALNYPWSFYRACLKTAAARPAPTTAHDDTPKRLTKAEVDDMVQKAMKGLL